METGKLRYPYVPNQDSIHDGIFIVRWVSKRFELHIFDEEDGVGLFDKSRAVTDVPPTDPGYGPLPQLCLQLQRTVVGVRQKNLGRSSQFPDPLAVAPKKL